VKIKIKLLVLVLLILPGCILVPAMDSVRRAGLTESSRQGLLPESLKKFNEAMQWGNPQEALGYVDDANQEGIALQLQDLAEQEKVVEAKIVGIDFKENAFKAIVNVTVRAYKVPFYVVKDRKEKQTWRFSVSDGWKMQTREVANSKPT